MALTHLPHVDGATEPYIADAVCALVAANDSRRVLETGGFLGHTSLCLAQTLAALDGPRELVVAEVDPARAAEIDRMVSQFFAEHDCGGLTWQVVPGNALDVIAYERNEGFCAAWIDDDHAAQHVEDEVQALFPKMRAGGLLLFHDVWGLCDLQQVVKRHGGLSLDFPRWGPAGGLGIIQV